MRKFLLFFILYYIGVWISHLSLLSIFTFFHFLLDHRLSVVETWVFERGWTIAFWSKLISFFVFYRLLGEQGELSFKVIKKLLMQRPSVWPLALSSLLIILITGGVKSNPNFSGVGFSMIQSYLGVGLYFLMDIIIIAALLKRHVKKIGLINKLSLALFSTGVTFFLTKFIFLYAKNYNAFFGLSCFLVFISFLFRGRLKDSLIVILFLVTPVSVLLGQDFMWGTLFSAYYLSQPPGLTLALALSFMSILYLAFLNKSSVGKS